MKGENIGKQSLKYSMQDNPTNSLVHVRLLKIYQIANKSNELRITTRPKEHICKPLVCMKSVNVLPSTGESSREPKSAT